MQAGVRLLPLCSCPPRASPPLDFCHSGGSRGRSSHSSGLCLVGGGGPPNMATRATGRAESFPHPQQGHVHATQSSRVVSRPPLLLSPCVV